jgi:hypothetical protein
MSFVKPQQWTATNLSPIKLLAHHCRPKRATELETEQTNTREYKPSGYQFYSWPLSGILIGDAGQARSKQRSHHAESAH